MVTATTTAQCMTLRCRPCNRLGFLATKVPSAIIADSGDTSGPTSASAVMSGSKGQLAFDPWAFSEYDFDPWEFEKPKPKAPRPVEETFKPSLVARAKKRTVHPRGSEWVVDGERKLGDAYPFYEVQLNGQRYRCSCHDSQHGETRARRMCSHVLAVILYRRSGSDGEAGASGTQGGVLPPKANDAPTSLSGVPASHIKEALPFERSFGKGIPEVTDPRFGQPGLPPKIKEIHDHQWDAVCSVLEAFDDGADIVFVDAPTGSGKTLIGELVRREMQARALYVCSSITLQEQFLTDFTYAKLLKGRSNYPTELFPFPDVTAADCTKSPGDPESCLWCSHTSNCGYEQAKHAALSADVAVLNTAYLLAESNYVGRLALNVEDEGLVIVDECDVLEKELMGFVEFRVTPRRLERLQVEPPKKGVHKATIATWLGEDLLTSIRDRYSKLPSRSDDVRVIREKTSLERLMQSLGRVHKDLAGEGETEVWVRDYPKDDSFVLKPTKVNEYGGDSLWRHGPRWLCMSATIISGHELSDSLGIEESGLKWHVVKVPMTFPVKNRRIHVAPVANMANKHKEQSWPRMARAISNVLARHPKERVLVHTVSYDLTRYLTDALSESGLACGLGERPVITYRGAGERAGALERFRNTEGAVLLAPSFDRGVDLAGDDCRVVVVAKVPFPYLGDRQVSERMKLDGGQAWYTVQTIRSLVQMTGRGVRSKEDWCTTYILDQQFVGNILKKHKHLLPGWWTEALDLNFPTRELM